uniref:Transposase n=1 Tax=Steinernema glaseri TaxID=37863 RepID=A0A1I7YXV9_9BILA
MCGNGFRQTAFGRSQEEVLIAVEIKSRVMERRLSVSGVLVSRGFWPSRIPRTLPFSPSSNGAGAWRDRTGHSDCAADNRDSHALIRREVGRAVFFEPLNRSPIRCAYLSWGTAAYRHP